MGEFFFNVMHEAGQYNYKEIGRERAPLSYTPLLHVKGGEVRAIFYTKSRRTVKGGDRLNKWFWNFISAECYFNVFVSDRVKGF
jgi:hypothetical protein